MWFWPCIVVNMWEKNANYMQQMIFIANLIACSTCFGHHYAHHQEFESIIQVVAACDVWCFGFQVVGLVWSWGLMCPVCGLLQQLLMMGIVVPETCWASNKICNKNHLLHVVGILFPHINLWFFDLPSRKLKAKLDRQKSKLNSLDMSAFKHFHQNNNMNENMYRGCCK